MCNYIAARVNNHTNTEELDYSSDGSYFLLVLYRLSDRQSVKANKKNFGRQSEIGNIDVEFID